MTEFVSKPQHVEAVQWTGDNLDEILRFAPGKTQRGYFGPESTTKGLWLLAGVDGAQKWVPVPVGHWLVHPPGDLSDIWPVEDAYFLEKYDDADPSERRGSGPFVIGSIAWPGTSEVIEALGETLQVLGKLINMEGGPSRWPDSYVRDRLVEELGDLLGAIGFFANANLSVEELIDVNTRSEERMRLFEQWQIDNQETS